MEIPQLSVSKIGLHVASPTMADLAEFGERLHKAFSTVGFAYITDHGIDKSIVTNAMMVSRQFFDLPQETKDSFPRQPDVQQGYVAPGREIFDQKEDGTKAIHEAREAFEVTRIEKEASFPDNHVPELRGALTTVAIQTRTLAYRVLQAIALSLGQEVDFFVKCHQRILQPDNISKLRSIFYPPLDSDTIKAGVVRCGEHSDYGTITFLYQDNLGGLEVRAVDDSWIAASPVPDSILINVGDLLEIYTNGIFRATLHRVVIPSEELKQRQGRQSIVFFLHPEHETVVQPLPGMAGVGAKNYTSTTALEHVNKRFEATYQY